MFAKNEPKTEPPKIRRYSAGKDCTGRGAFRYGEQVRFCAEVPRGMGCTAVVMRLAKDGDEPDDLPFSFTGMKKGADVYECTVDTGKVSEASGGLIYYEILFLRNERTLFTDSIDNVNFALREHNAARFRMLVYRKNYHTPAWMKGATMYHIFLDRFCRGDGKTELRKGASLDPDWESGVPQYAEKPGDPVANNVFFGGNLWGVCEKLDYLQSLGVTVLYLSPVFQAASNHRYDTGDYEAVDPLLGGEEALDRLFAEAHARGMKVVLDGVFNHTGDDSRYFNRYGTYQSVGAYQSPASPYRDWYRFRSYPDDYECWWGVKILPRLNHQNEDCRRYFTSPDGIAAKWIRRGADGWRLDVADELSDTFLDALRETVKEASGGQAAIIGEVWENAADKTAYGSRRKYLQGGQLDSVMNYPFRNAVLDLLRTRDTAFFVSVLTELYASYPREVCDSLMNLLGTHDTVRILTALGDGDSHEEEPNATLAKRRLSPADREQAIRLLLIASTLQFTVFGFPSVYYGDEAGMEGYRDPFCRLPFPWGRENQTLLNHYRRLGALRKKHPALRDGDFRFLDVRPAAFLLERKKGTDRVLVAVNLQDIPASFALSSPRRTLTVEPGSAAVVE